jgi:hypothetical protein
MQPALVQHVAEMIEVAGEQHFLHLVGDRFHRLFENKFANSRREVSDGIR